MSGVAAPSGASGDIFRINPEATVNTAQFLSNQVDQLEAELGSIVRQWTELSATWTGTAATAYEASWDDWHQSAKTVTAILSDSSDLLMQSAALATENESTSAQQLSAVAE